MGTITQQLLAWFDAGHGISTDSRKVKAGDVYFALKGERFDGNAYARQALESGAHAAVVDDPDLKGQEGMVLVKDGLAALQDLARAHRKRFQGKVIGLTGSNGKTTTKELLLAVLARSFRVAATHGNLNNEIGVPLTLLAMPTDLDFAIVEMGANAVGEIRNLCTIAEPDLGLITNIGLAHLEGFGGPEGVKRGKRELFEFLADRAGSRVFVNAGKANLMEVSEGQTRTLFGTPAHPPFAALLPDSTSGSAFLLHGIPEAPSGPHPLQIDGAHNLENALAALVIGHHLGVPWVAAIEAVGAYAPTNNRSQWTQARRNRVLLDAYNANPSSVELALLTFARAEHPAPLAILGDMAELGSYEAEEHARIVELAAGLELEVWVVGKAFSRVEGAERVRRFANVGELMQDLAGKPLEGRTILLKGSRSMELEQALPLL